MFYFQQLLNNAMNGIDSTNVISTITNMAFAILLIGFLIGLYQAAMRGGDLQSLAATAIKYLVVAMIVANWATVFRDVNGSFNAVANFIGNSSGAGDMFKSWMQQLQQQANTNPNLTFWDIITGDPAGTITVLFLFIAYLVYALAIIVFCFFYTLFGSVLYVLGPLVLALLPIAGIGQLAKTYAVNVMIWNAWGILYSIFGALITAIHFNQVNQVLGNGFLGFLQGVPDSVMLGLVSIFYALAVALVPFIAKRIISGDVGLAAFALLRSGAYAAGVALAPISGFFAGAATTSAASGGVGGAAGASRTAGTISGSGSTPPPQPSGMGDFIRSGVESATRPRPSLRGASASNGSSNENGNAKSAHSSRTNGYSARPAPANLLYRPSGVLQSVAFHAGRFAGKAVASNGGEQTSSNGNGNDNKKSS